MITTLAVAPPALYFALVGCVAGRHNHFRRSQLRILYERFRASLWSFISNGSESESG